jgi:diguanylate cyclase (GGDEF)-like protein
VVREELARASRTDPLTGSLNRRGFEQQAAAAIRAAASADQPLAVILVDLDGFKQVNDTAGHAAGDQVLREVTSRLSAASGPDGLIGRLGGDEFAVLLHGVDEAGAAAAGERLEKALEVVTRASVGVAVMPQHGDALDALLGSADRGLYETKLERRSAAPMLPELDLVARDLLA